MGKIKRAIAIATSRKWNEYLAADIAGITGRDVHLITQQSELIIDNLMRFQPEYVFFPHWSYIIPSDIYETFECVVFHMTDLPFGRGGSPLQNLILRGFNKTKISALRCERKLDAGPIYLKRELRLNGSAREIFVRAAEIIKEMILEIISGNLNPVPQFGKSVVFERRTPEQSDMQNNKFNSLESVFDFIRMLDANGYPKAFIKIQDYKIEFDRVHSEIDKLKGTFTIYKSDV